VGLQQPPRLRRVGQWAFVAAGSVSLTACSQTTQDEWKRGAMPEGAAAHSDSVISFWQWTWVTALIVGVLVWGLILFSVIKYRRRHDDEVPVQTRYNLPMELLYTVAPVIVVLVFFKYVIDTQNEVPHNTANGVQKQADHEVTVVGQQWSWTFNYVKDPALDGKTTVFMAGNPANIPTLYLPVGESVHFKLQSPDVIHSFWVPAFTYKLDVIPGSITNDFTMTPIREGTFEGRCAELCGTYHSRMLFNVKVVSASEFAQQLQDLKDRGDTGLVVGGGELPTGTNSGGQQSESGANE
jgi:cytochrome c oxidase subunit 2